MSDDLERRLREALPLLDGLETGRNCEEYAFAEARGFQAMTFCPEAFEALRSLPEAIGELARLRAENEALREALTPSGDTKAVYMGEFSFAVMHAQEDEDGEAIECPVKTYVPWATIKEIMAAIRARAALKGPSHE